MTQAVSTAPAAPRKKIVHDRPPMLAIGIMIWLGSELMFFSGLFAALFTIRANLAQWPPAGTDLDTLQAGIFTVILVASSGTMWMAVWHEEHMERAKARRWIYVSIVMGLMFLMNQVYEWTHFVHQLLRIDLLHHYRSPWASRLHRPAGHGAPARAYSRAGGRPG